MKDYRNKRAADAANIAQKDDNLTLMGSSITCEGDQ